MCCLRDLAFITVPDHPPPNLPPEKDQGGGTKSLLALAPSPCLLRGHRITTL